ncbi:dicarboxylate/amino acid:cation symporter [Thalassospira sp. HF15]|uniref:dicarboxylate/amino acid:cation symporter n=1 Tax=Thalassospira sp. HF15 TaxID=2722755 RepID=UPI0014301A2D|nr:dicarboxylate/amino acid:cation symporter [Thalassospira sp. HF15]NIY77114.1 dicarboxylate/amino acid:cation symporter [Thalassospira sp. HF15]
MTAGGDRLRRRSLLPFAYSLQSLVHGRLWLQVLVGMVAGVCTGLLLGPTTGLLSKETSAVVGNWLAFPGHLFLALIQMIVIPLVFSSIIRGLCSSDDIDQLRRLGVRATLFFVLTTAVSVTIGVALALFVRPGDYVDASNLGLAGAIDAPGDVAEGGGAGILDLPDHVLTLLPSNPLSSMVESNMLQVVIFASIFGVALVVMQRDKARPVLDLLASLQEVCLTIVKWAMWLAPFAVFGLMARLTADTGPQALLGMLVYVATVLVGLCLMLGILLAVARIYAGVSPKTFLHAAKDVMLLAFSTSSSAAVMPLSIRTAEGPLRVRKNISQFVIPLGATINMNGTALYQGVAAIFIAQVFGVEIGAAGLVLIVLTSVGASIGSPATPGVGIVILSTILVSIGVPASGIALIMGVDRLLDMSRTVLNVSGDLVACLVLDRMDQDDRSDIENKDEQTQTGGDAT